MLINKESEKHIRNLARCINRANKPYEKFGESFTLYELLNTKDLSETEKNAIEHDIFEEISQLLFELGIDYKDYPNYHKDWEVVTLRQLNLEKAKVKKGSDLKCSQR